MESTSVFEIAKANDDLNFRSESMKSILFHAAKEDDDCHARYPIESINLNSGTVSVALKELA